MGVAGEGRNGHGESSYCSVPSPRRIGEGEEENANSGQVGNTQFSLGWSGARTSIGVN